MIKGLSQTLQSVDLGLGDWIKVVDWIDVLSPQGWEENDYGRMN